MIILFKEVVNNMLGLLKNSGVYGMAAKGWASTASKLIGSEARYGKMYAGAAIGGLAGGISGMNSSDYGASGTMWGMAAGAGAGLAMGKWGGAAMGKLRTGASLGAAKGIGAIGNSKFLTNQGFGGKLGVGMATGMNKGAALMANKHAGKALFAAGAASAGLIGNSMLGSNRGY